MPADVNRDGTTCVLLITSTPFIITGSLFTSLNNLMGIPILLIGITMIVVGFAFIPGTRRAVRKVRSILDIIGIRKEVTITEICATTDLEREFVIDVLTKLVMSEHIYGYLEDDLFVRDVSRIRPQDLVDTGPFGDSMNS